MTERVEHDADVVVVGFGGSGAAAAITAADLGGRVVLLEKETPATHLPSSALFAGGAMFVTDVERGARYLDRCASGFTPYEVSHSWARKAFDLEGWINELDPGSYRLTEPTPSAEHPDIEGAEVIVSSNGLWRDADGTERPTAGAGLFAALNHAVRARPIDVRFGARAVRLVQSSTGRVTGVDYEHSGTVRRASARRGVVLATGGFEFNEEMKRQFLPVHPTHFYGSRSSTGDGIVLAQAVGASLWHMNLMMGRGVGHFEHADGSALNTILLLANARGAESAGYVITDKYGARFANEDTQAELGHAFYFHMIAFDPARHEYPRVPSYWFFDERRRRGGPLTRVASATGRTDAYQWSADNRREIEQGWIARGATIAEAAAAAGLADPDGAQATVSAYNDACRAGADRFGRADATMVPLDEPPYYSVALWPGGTNTSGGPRRDHRGQIQHAAGHSIPGLYGAGGLGQNMGPLYPGRLGYYSDVLCSGRIAGESVMSD